MAMEYINYIRAKAHLSTATKSETPVLSEEDELFLNRVTTNDDESPPPLPARPAVEGLSVVRDTKDKDAQLETLAEAQKTALPPATPNETKDVPPITQDTTAQKMMKNLSRPTWSWIRRDSREAKRRDQEETASGLMDVAAGLKAADAKPNDDGEVEDHQAKKEEEEMTTVLERLNLAAVNNRVFSISAETQELLQQFNLVFKDLMNGVPTAYDDLEKLLTNGDRQLQKTFNNLPSFLQKLIEQLPSKMTAGFAPEIMAAAAARAEKGGLNMENAGKAAAVAKKMGFKTPGLKDLVGKPGAVAGMMRTIMAFLRARFPAFLGMNVLWSLALFVLLFVFWYCHKRGREVRLEKERLLTEEEVAKLEKEYAEMSAKDPPTTTAPAGASMEDVQAGMIEVELARQAAADLEAVPEGGEISPDQAEGTSKTAAPENNEAASATKEDASEPKKESADEGKTAPTEQEPSTKDTTAPPTDSSKL